MLSFSSSLRALAAKKNMKNKNPFEGRFTNASEKRTYVRNLFSSIPNHYDFMNRIMSLGLDMSWRRKSIRLAEFKADSHLLDLAAGSGDMTIAAQKILPGARFIGLDFCEPLLRLARTKFSENHNSEKVEWIQGDALDLPFADNSLDGAFTAFALRNVTSVEKTFAELFRVIRPGGKVVSLEMVKQKNEILRHLFSFYFKHIIPRLGRWLTKYPDAYSYLPLSIENFYTADGLSDVIQKAGWMNVRRWPVMFRNVAIHVAEKKIAVS